MVKRIRAEFDLHFDSYIPERSIVHKSKTVSILLADDHAVVRIGLRSLLETQPNWQVSEAHSGPEAVEEALRLNPDVIIMDIKMPGDGMGAARLILKALPRAKILAISGYAGDDTIDNALDAGVQGFVFKADPEADVLAAVTALLQGKTYFTPIVSRRLKRKQSPPPSLTNREQEVLLLLAEGKGNRETAQILGISERTVENHRARIMHKLDLRSFSDLIRYAVRNELISV